MKGSIKKFVVVVLSMVLSLALMDAVLPGENNVAVVEAATKTPKLNKTKATLIKGQTVQLKLSNSKNVKWSSSKKSVATVSKSGKVTAKKKGTAVISAKYNGKTYKCTVTVEIPKLNKTTLTLKEGDKCTLKLSGTKQKVTWGSSNKKVATVKNGVVTAKSAGIAKITARIGTKKYVCSVTVEEKKIPIISLTASQMELSMKKGEVQQITVSALPQNTTEIVSLSYVSSNSAVATVDGNGNITAVGGGNTIITISHGSVSTTVKVNVTVPITGISLDKTDVVMKKGETTSLQCTINPEDTTERKIVIWSSDNTNIVTVDNGNISAVGAGTTKIKASVSGFTVECNVTVNVPIQSISLDKTNIEIAEGNTETLLATINPTDTTEDKTVTWESSDNSIATVDGNGVVKGIKAGTVKITAKVADKEVTCYVVVKNNIEANVQKLKNYISSYGNINSDGNKFIKSSHTSNNLSVEVGIVYEVSNDKLKFISTITSSGARDGLSMYVDILNNNNVSVDYILLMNPYSVDATAIFDATQYSKDSSVYFKLNNSNAFSERDIQNISNAALRVAFTEWNILLNSKLGMELADLGFTAYK